MLIEGSRESCNPVMIRGLRDRRSGKLKSYFVEHILLTFFKEWLFFNKMDMYSEVIYFKIIAIPISVCFISQINIMHEYTETESKYTDKIRTYSMWE